MSSPYTRESIDAQVEQNLYESLNRNIPFKRFISIAFQVEDVDELLAFVSSWRVDEDAGYKRSLEEYKAAGLGEGQRAPFARMANMILTRARADPRVIRQNRLAIKFLPLGQTAVIDGHAERKPDLVVVQEHISKDSVEFADIIDVGHWQKAHKGSTEAATKGNSDLGSERSGYTPRVSDARAHPDLINSTSAAFSKSRSARRVSFDEVQLASYAAEILSDGTCRRFARGFSVNDDILSLWHFDRCSVAESECVNFVKHPDLFSLFVVSLYRCPDFGLNSIFDNTNGPASGHLPNTACPGARLRLGSTLRFNKYSPTHWPDEARLSLGKLLHAPYSLVGRGTSVYELEVDGLVSHMLVVKVSWPVSTRVPEDEIIHAALNANVTNVPKLYASCTLPYGVETERLRAECESPSSHCEDRVLRITIFRRYYPISEIPDLEDFKAAFLDIVKCHHDLYATAGILHSDISVGNLMYEPGDGTSRPTGILCDFDLATVLAEEQTITNPSSKHRIGTAPFMSVALLVGSNVAPDHCYWHDLESFLYVLVWIAVISTAKGAAALQPWMNGTWKQIGMAKRIFLILKEGRELLAFTSKPYEPLRDQWLKPLRAHFGRYYWLEAMDDLDEDTLDESGGHTTPDGRISKQEEYAVQKLTYQGFLRCIHVQGEK